MPREEDETEGRDGGGGREGKKKERKRTGADGTSRGNDPFGH